jgi:hypothetical protein
MRPRLTSAGKDRPQVRRVNVARYAGGGKNTIEGCRSVDVLEWHRRGYLRSRWFSLTWSRDGEQVASIKVETQRHSPTLKYQSRSWGEDWSNVEQRIAIAWTPFRFGGERPWFVCSVTANGVYCGRRVTKLYGAGRLFACRHCYRLAYASQQEPVRRRGLGKSQKIRMRLGGSPNMLEEEFPDKPKGMHWRTYERWRRVHNAAEERWRSRSLQYWRRAITDKNPAV